MMTEFSKNTKDNKRVSIEDVELLKANRESLEKKTEEEEE